MNQPLNTRKRPPMAHDPRPVGWRSTIGALGLSLGLLMGGAAHAQDQPPAPAASAAAGLPVVAAPPAAAQPVPDFLATVVPYKDYPFPSVPRGEVWRPVLSKVAVSTFVPTGNDQLFPQAAKDLLSQARARVAAGDGRGAIELLTSQLDAIPDGAAQEAIGNIYLAGSGGVEKNTALGREWMEKAAEFDPHLFQWLGRTLGDSEEDITLKIHFWSKGLARGCTGCFGSLAKLRRKKEVQSDFSFDAFFATGKGRETRVEREKVLPDELLLQYVLYAVDMGDLHALEEVGAFVSRLSVGVGVKKAPMEGIGQAVYDTAVAHAGKDTRGSLASAWGAAIGEHLRTGLVPGNLQLALVRLEERNHAAAVNALVTYSRAGRHYPEVANAVMSQVPPGTVTDAEINMVILRAANAGDVAHVAAAALVLKEGHPLVRWTQQRWEIYRPGPATERSKALWQGYVKHATRAGRMPLPVLHTINNAEAQVSADKAAANARACLAEAAASKSATVLTWLYCRSDTERAWYLTDEVDFGQLNDRLFERLLAVATADYQAEYDRRLRAASDKITRDQVARADPRRDLSNQRITSAGRLREQNDAFARMNSENFRNMPNHHGELERWLRSFNAQRARVAEGRARDLRDATTVRGSAETCALWSLKVMPFCKLPPR
jgi:hypothetical protein